MKKLHFIVFGLTAIPVMLGAKSETNSIYGICSAYNAYSAYNACSVYETSMADKSCQADFKNSLADETSLKNFKSINEIYEPTIVGIPPSDSYIGLSILPDKEIRHYNYGEHSEYPFPCYIRSKDNGMTWNLVKLPKEIPYADQQSPVSGEYIRLFSANGGVYAMRTQGGLEGGRNIIKIDNEPGIMNKPPIFIRGGKRIISGAHRTDRSGAFVYYSDDDGLSWKISEKVNAPLHNKGGFHQGIRWNHGAVEPTIVELKDGRLWMLMRTSLDYHYQSYSSDGGETWSEPSPSPFYGTITMPTLFRMRDGRLLFFWCNTTPLPELPTANGIWDDVFTNRDAVHVAVSDDDGLSWKGFREILLNPERNSPVFGDTKVGEDKSVHQVQAVEVEPGKILVSVGQHKKCRRLLMFDVKWLYEPTRSCDFSNGLDDWSAFRYYKGIVGHCSYNRQAEKLLVSHPDYPDKPDMKVLQLGYTPNDSLVQDNDGAVWNFPAAPDGSLSVRLQLPDKNSDVQLILNDRWFNPTDTVAGYECMYKLKLNRKQLKINDSKWHDMKVFWHNNKPAKVYIDGKNVCTLKNVRPTLHGVSYLHLLGGRNEDTGVVRIEFVEGGKILM